MWEFMVVGLFGEGINCGGLVDEKGEEGGGESPWFCAVVLGEKEMVDCFDPGVGLL